MPALQGFRTIGKRFTRLFHEQRSSQEQHLREDRFKYSEQARAANGELHELGTCPVCVKRHIAPQPQRSRNIPTLSGEGRFGERRNADLLENQHPATRQIPLTASPTCFQLDTNPGKDVRNSDSGYLETVAHAPNTSRNVDEHTSHDGPTQFGVDSHTIDHEKFPDDGNFLRSVGSECRPDVDRNFHGDKDVSKVGDSDQANIRTKPDDRGSVLSVGDSDHEIRAKELGGIESARIDSVRENGGIGEAHVSSDQGSDFIWPQQPAGYIAHIFPESYSGGLENVFLTKSQEIEMRKKRAERDAKDLHSVYVLSESEDEYKEKRYRNDDGEFEEL